MKDDGENTEKIHEELTKIRTLLEIVVRGSMKNELEKIATTPERKKIWSLCNGSIDTKGLAEEVGISRRAVNIFLKDLKELDLVVTEKWGYPQRRFDYIPSEWDIK